MFIETARAAQVEILGSRSSTFEVGGHHYALVIIEDLQPGASVEYEVRVDGAVCWPLPAARFRRGARMTAAESASLLEGTADRDHLIVTIPCLSAWGETSGVQSHWHGPADRHDPNSLASFCCSTSTRAACQGGPVPRTPAPTKRWLRLRSCEAATSAALNTASNAMPTAAPAITSNG